MRKHWAQDLSMEYTGVLYLWLWSYGMLGIRHTKVNATWTNSDVVQQRWPPWILKNESWLDLVGVYRPHDPSKRFAL